MTWRSLIWRTLKVTLLRPYFQRRYRACLRRIAQLERQLWPPDVSRTNYTQVIEQAFFFGATDFSDHLRIGPGTIIPINPGGSVHYFANTQDAA